MEVFIGNLPGAATLLEINSFLEGTVLRRDFQLHRGRDAQDRSYHFLVARAGSREEGEALISRLNGQLFQGHPLEAHEYRPRTSRAGWKGQERRLNPW